MNTTAYIFCCFAIACAFNANSSSSVELQRSKIDKYYAIGDRVALGCTQYSPQECVLEVRIDGVNGSVELDFRPVGLLPTLDSISLDVTDRETMEFSVVTGVNCRQKELDQIKKFNSVSSECMILFDVDGKEVSWKAVVVYPIASLSVYSQP